MAMEGISPKARAEEERTIAYLQTPQAIRDRCQMLFELALEDRLSYFRCDLTRLPAIATYVVQVMATHYPDREIPFHSRWRHFDTGGIPRLASLESQLAELPVGDRVKAKLDLAVVSVLLDAGAGASWRYQEPDTGQVLQRSEGLAVASYHLFLKGFFSSDPDRPYRVDATALQALTEWDLARALQVRDSNPLVGLSGRLALLHGLGQALGEHPTVFGTDSPRPGNLAEYALKQAQNGALAATQVFAAVMTGLQSIWPGRLTIAGINLGDVWVHPHLPEQNRGDRWVPFHKLAQWLTYSLLEPLEELGLQIMDLDALTGLAEYRNGGLLLDLGFLQLKQPGLRDRIHAPSDPLIVEWRALTIVGLDRLAIEIRSQLGMSGETLPLVKILQGGTWNAGRQVARELRPDGVPPLLIQSNGTVF